MTQRGAEAVEEFRKRAAEALKSELAPSERVYPFEYLAKYKEVAEEAGWAVRLDRRPERETPDTICFDAFLTPPLEEITITINDNQ